MTSRALEKKTCEAPLGTEVVAVHPADDPNALAEMDPAGPVESWKSLSEMVTLFPVELVAP